MIHTYRAARSPSTSKRTTAVTGSRSSLSGAARRGSCTGGSPRGFPARWRRCPVVRRDRDHVRPSADGDDACRAVRGVSVGVQLPARGGVEDRNRSIGAIRDEDVAGIVRRGALVRLLPHARGDLVGGFATDDDGHVVAGPARAACCASCGVSGIGQTTDTLHRKMPGSVATAPTRCHSRSHHAPCATR